MDQAAARSKVAEKTLRGGVHDLEGDSASLAALTTWAHAQPMLAAAHRHSYLAWHCAGRMLLTIRRTRKGVVVKAGVHYSGSAPGTHPPPELVLAGRPPTADELGSVIDSVQQGVKDRLGEADAGHEEHRLQAAMAAAPAALGRDPARRPLREVPARRPGGGIAFIDFLRLDADSVLHVVETKIGHDEMLVLQGLDYLIWAQANRDLLSDDFKVKVQDVVVDYVLGMPKGGAAGTAPVLSPYAPAQLESLDPTVRWRVHILGGWAKGELKVVSLAEGEVPDQPYVRRRTGAGAPGRDAYRDRERVRAARWKNSTAALPEPARAQAPYRSKNGDPGGHAYEFCLPRAFAEYNLLAEVRAGALQLFADLGIHWHAGVATGPSNHLLSSQVQCVNALAGMANDPRRIQRAFGHVLDIAEVGEIEPGRHLTFEYIGPTDYFGESASGQRIRGALCTSVDAAFLYTTSQGKVELALVEWKYTEQYRRRRSPEPHKDDVRRGRYHEDWMAVGGPLDTDIVPFGDMLDEPFYQLMRGAARNRG